MQGLQHMHYLGLDISKHTIDTYSDICGHCKIDNTIQGIQGLLGHLQANGLGKENTHICCEATNVYYLLVATTLHQNGYAVSVVNPLAIKGYAKMQLKRIKTDKQDAKLIADFAKKKNRNAGNQITKPEKPYNHYIVEQSS